MNTETKSIAHPDPEVIARPTRRRFTAEYKKRILAEARLCTQPGDIGALLRREGLYASTLTKWRLQENDGLVPKKRGRKPLADGSYEEKRRLQRENARLRRKLEQAEAVIEVQKKVSILLGITLNQPENDENV